MKRATCIITCVFLGLALLLGASWGWAQQDEKSQDEEKCCFTNSRYTGVCEVTPGEDETCESILEYLNSPNSVGKTYCGNTRIRGGWEQVPCNEKQAALPGECLYHLP